MWTKKAGNKRLTERPTYGRTRLVESIRRDPKAFSVQIYLPDLGKEVAPSMVAMAHYLGHFAVIYIQVFISVNRYLNVVSRLNVMNPSTINLPHLPYLCTTDAN